MPGCCGIVVSSGAYVTPCFRGKGLGKLLCEMRSHIAYECKYSLMLCTDVSTNIPQQKILESCGWTKQLEFRNKKTMNNVCLHTTTPKPGKYDLGFEVKEFIGGNED